MKEEYKRKAVYGEQRGEEGRENQKEGGKDAGRFSRGRNQAEEAKEWEKER